MFFLMTVKCLGFVQPDFCNLLLYTTWKERSLQFWEPVLSAILLFWQTVAQAEALKHQVEMQTQRNREAEYQQSLQSLGAKQFPQKVSQI